MFQPSKKANVSAAVSIGARNPRVAAILECAPVVSGGTVLTSSSGSKDIIEEGDFYLDLNSREATLCGRELRLTSAEFDVLVFLLSHRRRLITSHTKLATKTTDNEVRQAAFLPALLSLRRKLNDEAPGVPYINTEAWILFDFHPTISRH